MNDDSLPFPLPIELNLAVLSYLTAVELDSAKLLSRIFNVLCRDEILWKHKYRQHFPHLPVNEKTRTQTDFSWQQHFKKTWLIEYKSMAPEDLKLLVYIKEGETQAAKNLLTLRKLLEVRDKHHDPLIRWVVRSHNQILLNIIYERACFTNELLALNGSENRANARDLLNMTLMHWAAICNQTTAMQTFIAAGMDVNRTGYMGATALYCAADAGHLEIVKMLIAAGADVNQGREDNATPLYIAAQNGHVAVVMCLLQHGADITRAVQPENASPLHIAVDYNHPEVVDVLLAYQAPVDALMEHNQTALYLACQMGRAEVASRLLAAKASTTICDARDGYTPLYAAVHRHHMQLVALLLDKGADPNLPTKHDCCPLMLASARGYVDCVELLLQAGADVNQQQQGITPLMMATYFDRRGVVTALLAANADIHQVATMHRIEILPGQTVMDIALRMRHDDIAVALEAHRMSQCLRHP